MPWQESTHAPARQDCPCGHVMPEHGSEQVPPEQRDPEAHETFWQAASLQMPADVHTEPVGQLCSTQRGTQWPRSQT